jgi:hypothetical protein
MCIASSGLSRCRGKHRTGFARLSKPRLARSREPGAPTDLLEKNVIFFGCSGVQPLLASENSLQN